MGSVVRRGLQPLAVAVVAVLLVAAYDLAGALAAPAVYAAANGPKTTLNIWESGANQQLVLGANEFEKTHPNIKIQFDIAGSGSYNTKVDLAMKTGQVPDLFETWGGGLVFNQFLPHHQMVDVSNSISGIKSDYIPTVLAPIESNGGVYAVPFTGTQPDAIYYNKSDFQRAGIKKPPATWQELLTDVKTLKSHNIIPISMGNETWMEMMWPQYIATKLGGSKLWQQILLNKPNAWSDPQMSKALSLTQQLLSLHPFEPGFQGIQWANGQPTRLLATGQTAMELQGAWEVNNMQQLTPSFASGNDLGYFAFPSVPGASKTADKYVAGNPATYLSLPAASPHRQQAMEFLKFMTTKAYNQIILKTGQVPGTPGAQNLLKSAKINGVTKQWDAYSYKIAAQAGYFQQSWDQALPPGISTEMTDDVGKMFAGSMSPSQFMSDLDNQESNAG